MTHKAKLGLIAGIGLLTAGVGTAFAGDHCRSYKSSGSHHHKAQSHYNVKKHSNYQYRTYTRPYTTYQNHYRNDRRRYISHHNHLRFRAQAANHRNNVAVYTRAGIRVR